MDTDFPETPKNLENIMRKHPAIFTIDDVELKKIIETCEVRTVFPAVNLSGGSVYEGE
jgi:hypothetical protein